MKFHIDEIIKLINKHVLKSLLLKNSKKWNLMCGSIDSIRSTELAIDSYSKLAKKGQKRDVGFEFLVIYGFFQALYVQQDSVINLYEAVGNELPSREQLFKKYPDLKKIRNLRNNGVGHPSKDYKGGTHNIMPDGDSIELFSYTNEGEFSHRTYRVSECIEKQSQALCEIFGKIVERLKYMERKHKEKYGEKKLHKCFPDNYQDSIDKIFDAIDLIGTERKKETKAQKIGRQDAESLAHRNAKRLVEATKELEQELDKRELEEGLLRLVIKYCRYPLESLKNYFENTSASSINSQDARAYADSADIRLKDLIEEAKKLDQEYSTLP